MRLLTIDRWDEDPDFPVHPIGSQPKRVVIAPPEASDFGLRPRHTYIFKGVKAAWQAAQLWSEIIAYKVGRLVNINTPRCFPAALIEKRQVGVLMESFLDKADCPGETFIHGADFLGRVISDKKRGRPHLLTSNIWVSRIVCGDEEAPLEWWIKTIFFDALIGNSDRHPQNWGFIFRPPNMKLSASSMLWPERRGWVSMGPVFDNGTSLGYETQENDLAAKSGESAMSCYIGRGRHHCSWDRAAPKGETHITLCGKLIEQDETRSQLLEQMLSYNPAEIGKILAECVACEFPLQPFSSQRAYYISKLLERRRAALLKLVK